jgi:uncharacterized protein (DUF58 family)
MVKKPGGSRWLLIIIMGILFFGWATTGIIIYIRLFLLILLLIITSLFWSLMAIRGIQLLRRTRSLRTSVGRIFDEHFDVVNTSRWVCLWLEIQDNSPIPQKSGSRLLTSIGGKRQRSYTARTRITKRGAYPLGPTNFSSGDLFGFFTSNRLIQTKDTLVALPLTVDIQYFPAPSGLLPGGREIHQKTLDVTPHATGVREYIPGDPMKRIHWPSSAKRDHFMVKVYELDPEAEIWFFLDSQGSVQFSRINTESEIHEDDFIHYRRTQIRLPDDTYEYSISVTASLAKYYLRQKKVVGLVSSGNKVTIIRAERGERQIGKILETLSFLKADGDLPLVGCVNMQVKYLPMGSSVIIVTPSISIDLLIAVEDLTRRKLHPMVLFILAESIGGPGGSEKIIMELEKRNIPVVKIKCGEDLDKQLSQMRITSQKFWKPS